MANFITILPKQNDKFWKHIPAINVNVLTSVKPINYLLVNHLSRYIEFHIVFTFTIEKKKKTLSNLTIFPVIPPQM